MKTSLTHVVISQTDDDKDVNFDSDSTRPSDDEDGDQDQDCSMELPDPSLEFCDKETQTCEEEFNQKIAEAIINALPLKQQQGDSIKSFEGWLKWAKDFVLTDQEMKDAWPTSWSETEDILRKVGYESPKHYYICMSDQHAREWDIMESPTDKCRNCGEPGTIDYYYMGLSSKVKRWYGNPVMCCDMLDHWREKDHWFYNYENGETQGWPIKELWDGTRFSQYSWFFDKEMEYLQPVICPHCEASKQTYVISAPEIASYDVLENNTVDIICPNCRNLFNHAAQYVSGDPRNIVYIAHWDGFSPFGTSGGHSTGVIDVKVANMSKTKRNHADQVFVVGFVPCYKTPDETPEFLDPFLTPLINEIVNGFIDGIEVEYAADFPEFDIQKGPAVIRHLILLWTGDHPGQCEVTKVKRTGKKACRHCHVCGIQLEPGSHHYYYGHCRYHGRHHWATRNMEESIPLMKKADEEEGAAWARVSRDSGFTGLSKLVTLYNLYGFDVLHDTPIDLMHNLPMNPVKKHLRLFLDSGNGNQDVIESRLSNFPWTAEMKASRYPSGLTTRLGYWKAEDYQKFAFPASEVILSDQMPADQFQCWKLLVQMVQMVFNVCRTYGWQEKDIQLFRNLAWRHNILVEETFGLNACVVTEHNLIHVADDISRFSSPDNYWVFDLERAVKRYVNQSTNHRNIEKTYSDNEARREVLQNLDIVRNKNDTSDLTQSEFNSAIKLKKVSSLHKGNAVIAKAYNTNVNDVKNGLLIGGINKTFQAISESQQQEIWQDLNFHSVEIEYSSLPCVTQLHRSFLKPGEEPSGPHVLYRQGESIIFSANNEERTGRINAIHSFTTHDEDGSSSVHIFPEVQLYEHVTDNNGHLKYHPGTQSQYLHLSGTIKMVNVSEVLRKVILYPDEACSYHYILIDFQMPSLPPEKQFIVVPFYPERNDMVLVLGDNDVQWIGKIVSVQSDDKKVGVLFYKEHPRWPGGNKFIKESSTVHSVHWNSITKSVKGTWLGNGTWQLQENESLTVNN